jgi:hypothetical protein
MCTTSIECKTVITVVLMVKNGMDPDIIHQDFGWFGISSVVRISSWSSNILVESPSWIWKFLWGVIQLELETQYRFI